MNIKRFAIITEQGTAVAETTLCSDHLHANIIAMRKLAIQDKEVISLDFVDVSENTACRCQICDK